MTDTQIATALEIGSAVGALMASTAYVVWFISDQFKRNRDIFWKAIADLSNAFTIQLNDHQKSDDRRFDKINDRLFDIQKRNAVKDQTRWPERE